MLTKSETSFTFMFFVILVAELICGSSDNLFQLHYITKPAIVMSLIVFFWKEGHSVSKSIRHLTFLALLFSLLGDVLLIFVEHSSNYFMFGLVAFLLAHVMYVLVFLKQRNASKKPSGFIILMTIYAIGLFYFLRKGLGEMIVPVLIYMTTIVTMSITAFLREGIVTKMSYHFVFLGAILFMVSDSLLALNKFHEALPLSNILIMLTYALAQYFIVFGIKKSS